MRAKRRSESVRGTRLNLLSRDRGRFVRTQEQYLDLAHTYFQELKAHLREDVLRIPYMDLILKCLR